MIAWVDSIWPEKRSSKQTQPFTPFFSAASKICITSANEFAIGFSRMMCFFALAAATAWAQCWLG